MGKSLRSKRKQKIKAIKRAKCRETERRKCWEKYLTLQVEKNGDMVTEDTSGNEGTEKPNEMETDCKPQISRKKVLQMLKNKDARKKRKKSKRLGGKRAHSKW